MALDRLDRGIDKVVGADGVDLPGVFAWGTATWVYIPSAGNVAFRLQSGTITFENLAPGRWHRMMPFVGIEATGTTVPYVIVGY